jgi:hypothetical protein
MSPAIVKHIHYYRSNFTFKEFDSAISPINFQVLAVSTSDITIIVTHISERQLESPIERRKIGY